MISKSGLFIIVLILIISYLLFHKNINPSFDEGFEAPQQGFPSGYFKIRNRVNNKCLDISGGTGEKGAKGILWDCNDGLHQQWYVDSLGRLKNRLSNRCLEIQNSQSTNGTIVQLGDCTGGSNQQWFVDSSGRIKTRLNNSNLAYNENDQSQPTQVYIWSDPETPSQRWYFERIDQPKQILRLATSFDGLHDKPLQIPNQRLDPSNDYTYYFWLKITDPKYKQGQWRHLLHKGTADTKQRSPGIWIFPNDLKFHFRCTTTKSWDEGCDPDYIIPVNEWIFVAYVLNGTTLSGYVNGQLLRQCILSGMPNNNDGNVYIGMAGFGGQMKNIEYANYPMTKADLAKRMDETLPIKKCTLILPLTFALGNILKNSDLKTGWQSQKLTDIVFNESCPPNGLGGQTVSFSLAQGDSSYYSYGNYAPMKSGIMYRCSLWIKTDEPTDVLVKAYTGSDAVAKDGVSRLYTAPQPVNKDDGWKQLTWIFTNPKTSKAQSLSFLFSFNKNPIGRTTLFLPNLISIASNDQQVVYRNIIKNVKYSSDDSYPAGAQTVDYCRPENAELNNPKAWCAGNKMPMKNYLQLDLNDHYHLTQIVTQGRGDSDQWTTDYSVYYKDPNDKWIHYKDLKGNTDRNTYQINDISLITSAIRIYPTKWFGHPSMRVGLMGEIQPVQKRIKIVKLTSNGTHKSGQQLDKNCLPDNANLDNPIAWCAETASPSKYYLQATFDQTYKVTAILTQGRPTTDQWVTEYAVYYQIPATNQWEKFNKTFQGNTDRNSVKSNPFEMITQGLRIYPTKWKGWPSMRVGFEGFPQKLNKCQEYENQSKYATSAGEKQKYTDLYNNECRQISYADHQKAVQNEKDSYMKLNNQFNELKSSCKLTQEQTQSLQKQLNNLNTDLQKAHLETQLATAKKCPPSQQQVPAIAPPVVSVPIAGNQQLQQQFESVQKELNRCQGEFNLNNNNINKMQLNEGFTSYNSVLSGLPSSQTGQLQSPQSQSSQPQSLQARSFQCASKPPITVCAIGTPQTVSTSTVPQPVVTTSTTSSTAPVTADLSQSIHKYDITRHKDFQKIMATMMLKAECAVPKDELSKYIKKADCAQKLATTTPPATSTSSTPTTGTTSTPSCPSCPQCQQCPTDQKQCPVCQVCQTCPPIPTCPRAPVCKELKDYPINQHPNFNNYISKDQMNAIIKSMPIEKHPQFQQFMDKYAIRDSFSCPPTFRPCSFRIDATGKMMTKAGEPVIYTSPDGQTYYKISQQGNMVKVTGTKETILEGICPPPVLPPPPKTINDFDITTHKDYTKVLDKYALRSNNTYLPCKPCKPCPVQTCTPTQCPPIRCPPPVPCATPVPCPKPIPPKTINDFDIKTHKDYNMYIPKNSIPKCPNCPSCPPPQQTQCAPCRPLPCPVPILPPQKTINDFNITTHKDYNKYIPKTDIPKYQKQCLPCSPCSPCPTQVPVYPQQKQYSTMPPLQKCQPCTKCPSCGFQQSQKPKMNDRELLQQCRKHFVSL